MRRGDPAALRSVSVVEAKRARRGKGRPMIPAAFDYHRPDTLDEALKLLKKHGDDAKVLSGGMSCCHAQAAPCLLCPSRRYQRFPAWIHQGREGTLRIGAMTRQAALERSDVIKSKYPILATRPLIATRWCATAGHRRQRRQRDRERPAGDHDRAGATFVARLEGASIPANQFYKDCTRPPSRATRSSRDRIPAPRPRARRLRQAQAQDRGFRGRRAAVQLTLARAARSRAPASL